MIARPNAFQKLLHQIFMLRPVTGFFAPWVHHLDKTILKLTKGKYAVSEILGWNIIQLTTIGAKTNQPRTMPLVGLFDGEKIALIASSLGREHNPGWYYNLKKIRNAMSTIWVVRRNMSPVKRKAMNTRSTGSWRSPITPDMKNIKRAPVRNSCGGFRAEELIEK